MRNIQHQSSGSIRYVDRILAAQLKTHIILRQKGMPHFLPDLRLMLTYPNELGESEVRQCGVRRQFEKTFSAHGLRDPPALFIRPLIAPDDRRPQYRAVLVEEHSAMHLPRESHAADFLPINTARRKDGLNRFLRRAPPVCRILLCPCCLRRSERRVFACRGSKNRSVLAYKD